MIDIAKLLTRFEMQRVRNGHTKANAADAIGVTMPSLIKYFNGEIPLHKIKKLCEYSNISVDDVLKVKKND